MSERVILNYVMLNSNKPVKVAHLQKLANQSMLYGAFATEFVNNSFSESKKTFGRLIKRGTFYSKKNRDMGSGKYIFTRFP